MLFLQHLAHALLLDLVGLVGLGLLLVGLDLVAGLQQRQLLVLLGDGGLGLHLGLVALLLRLRTGDGRVALLLHHVLDGHGLDDLAVLVGEVLDGQVDDLKAHVAHVAHGGLDGFLGELVAVLHQFRDRHLTDDLTHIAFQHVLCQGLDLFGIVMQQLLCSRGNGQVVRTDLDVGDSVHQHGDIFFGGNGLRRSDVHLRQAHIQLVDPLNGGNDEGGSAAHDPVTEFLGGNRTV